VEWVVYHSGFSQCLKQLQLQSLGLCAVKWSLSKSLFGPRVSAAVCNQTQMDLTGKTRQST